VSLGAFVLREVGASGILSWVAIFGDFCPWCFCPGGLCPFRGHSWTVTHRHIAAAAAIGQRRRRLNACWKLK